MRRETAILMLLIFAFAIPTQSAPGETQAEAIQGVVGVNNGTIVNSDTSVWFKFNITMNYYYYFELNGPEVTDFDFELFNSNNDSRGFAFGFEYPDTLLIFASTNETLYIEVYSSFGTGDFTLEIQKYDDPNAITDVQYSLGLQTGDIFTFHSAEITGDTSKFPYTEGTQIVLEVLEDHPNLDQEWNASKYFSLTFDGQEMNSSWIDLFVAPIFVEFFDGRTGDLFDYLYHNSSFLEPHISGMTTSNIDENGYYVLDVYNENGLSANFRYDPIYGIVHEIYYGFTENFALVANSKIYLDTADKSYIETLSYNLKQGDQYNWKVTSIDDSEGVSVYDLGDEFEMNVTSSPTLVNFNDNPFSIGLNNEVDDLPSEFFVLPQSVNFVNQSTGQMEDYAVIASTWLSEGEIVSTYTVTNSTHLIVDMISEIINTTTIYDLDTGLMVYQYSVFTFLGLTGSYEITLVEDQEISSSITSETTSEGGPSVNTPSGNEPSESEPPRPLSSLTFGTIIVMIMSLVAFRGRLNRS